DSTLPYIWLPLDACRQFEATFNFVWNETIELYLINDTLHSHLTTLNPTFTFTLGNDKTAGSGEGINITLPYNSFDLTAYPPLVSNSTRYFPLKRAANDSQYTLGRVFLQEA